ncbi:MAG: XisH family protein [Cyanobacteria bacterium P01_H01_bin.35]
MSAKDFFHDTVRVALEKDGWKITKDPLFLKLTQQFRINIDLKAEKFIVAEKSTRTIVVEIKSFVSKSAVSEFHIAVGQFLNYRLALDQLALEWVLDLAIPIDVYQDFFSDLFVQTVLEKYQIKLLVFNAQKQEITLWKN